MKSEVKSEVKETVFGVKMMFLLNVGLVLHNCHL